MKCETSLRRAWIASDSCSVARWNSESAALFCEAAALSCGLAFLPMFRERYDLVIPVANYRGPLLAPMLEIIASDEFKKIVNGVGGYDTSQTGTTTFLS